MNIWIYRERVSLWNCWMIKMLLQEVPGLKAPGLTPSSFLLLQQWNQRISQWQETPKAHLLLHSLPADVLCVALDFSLMSRMLVLLMASTLQGWPLWGQRGCRNPQLCTALCCLGWRHCPMERIFPLFRWKLGCMCQSKWPVPAPSLSGVSWSLLCGSPTWGGWKELKMRWYGGWERKHKPMKR